ncbi:MAG: hypothetical protein AAGI53_17690 [Planctomycetota bacterium]
MPRNHLALCLVASVALIVACGAGSTWGQVRVVSYNTLFGGPSNATEEALVSTIFDGIANESRNGIAKRPDIVALQEQLIFTGTNSTQNVADVLNTLYGVTTYQATFPIGGSLRLGYVYDSSTVTLESSAGIPVGIRSGVRAEWSVNGYTNADFYTYNVHLRAGEDQVDARLTESNNLRTNADALAADEEVIYLGDFNYNASIESGYLSLTNGVGTNPGNAVGVDPLQLSLWPSGANGIHNTQSTRTDDLPDGGATGGMDDRFDLQIVTSELMDNNGLSYIGPTVPNGASEHSYHAFGNDGLAPDIAINQVRTGRDYPLATLDALHDFSDHLPVVADYQLPGILSAEAAVDNDRVIVGGFTLAQIDVSNDATPVAAAGADTIDFEITSPTAIFTGSTTGEVAPLASAEERPAVILVTAPGVTTTDFDVASTADDLNDSLVTASVDVTGLSSAEASFEAGTTDTSLTIDFGEVALDSGGGSLSELFDVFNREVTAGFTSALDIDGVQPITGDTSTLSLSPWLTQVLAGDSASGTAVFDTSVLGNFSATWEIAYSDEDLPGETSGTLTVDLIGEVIAALLEGDYNGDGFVDGADYTFWANRFGGTTPDDLLADGNGDGFVDGADYTYWANRFGNTSNLTLDEINELFSPIAVPEPAVISLLVLLGLPYATRRRGRIAAA